MTLIPKPKRSGGARAATAQVGPANKRNDTKRCLPFEALLRPGEAVLLQGLADKGFIHAKSPKFDLFFGMKDKNKIEFDMWERQVLAAATDHSDTAIRQAMLQSLKGQALMVTTTLPPNTH